MRHSKLACALIAALLAGLSGCGGGSDPTTGSTATQQTGTLPLMVSDASSDDWATVGVKILSIALVPQGGGADVTVYSTTAAAAPYVNLEQLDQISEVLGNVSVPVGTYTGALITLSGNPGDVLLVSSADPESGFPAAASTQIPSADIQIQHTSGSSGSLTVPVNVEFVSPLVVSTSSSNALDLEFDLSHPAFVIAHQPPGAGTVLWAVNFTGPIRHHPVADITSLVLRHLYGTLSSVSSDGSALTVTRDWPTLPIVSPETAVTGLQSLSIDVDATNGTLYYDLDAGTSTTIKSFSDVVGLGAGEYLRIAARYQEGGTLVATRIWASSSFNNVWLSPEGHVLDVNAANGTITVMNAAGQPVPLAIDSSTQFFFHDGTTPIGSGTAFLSAGNLVRGFKIDASINPLATASPAVAETVNIETAHYSGALSAVSTSGFTYTHDYVRSVDDYSVALDYISSSSANGTDADGNPISGFKWWNFAYPTLITDGSDAITAFVSATSSTSLQSYGDTYATWGDPANANGWSAPMAVLDPVPVPLASVSNPLSGNTFTATTVATPTVTYMVNVDSTSGHATLVYQVDRNNGIVTVTPVDITTQAGLAQFTGAMVAGTPVKVYGVAEADGAVQAYVVLYYTGTLPMN